MYRSRMRIYLITSLLFLSVLVPVITAQSLRRPPRYPWHFADIWWTSEKPTNDFNEISIDFRIIGDVPDSVDLYIAPLGLIWIGPTKLYGGIQTRSSGWPDKKDHRLLRIGRAGIFSRWSVNNTKIPVEFADGPAGTHYESADYEDNFVSVRRKVNWKSGSYTYLVRRARTLATDRSYVWFTAYVRDNSNGTETEIGSLRVDGPNYSLYHSIAAFVEVYGSTSIIPELTVAFSEPRVNGVYRPKTAAKVVYPANGTINKPRFAGATKINREVIVYLRPDGIADGVTEESFR